MLEKNPSQWAYKQTQAIKKVKQKILNLWALQILLMENEFYKQTLIFTGVHYS